MSTGCLSAAEARQLRLWAPPYALTDAAELQGEGGREQRGLGGRLGGRFPGLFDAPYEPSLYKVIFFYFIKIEY